MVSWHEFKDELSDHGRAPLAFSAYLTGGHCVEAVFKKGRVSFYKWGCMCC